MTDKITALTLQKNGLCSTFVSRAWEQVRNHRESTERQYALQDRARAFGWPLVAFKYSTVSLGRSGFIHDGSPDNPDGS